MPEPSDRNEDNKSSRAVTHVSLLGVDYWHAHTSDGGDLYATRYGRPFMDILVPENWFERSWFDQNRERLTGTSVVYRVRTKTVNGRSLDIVVKWCRVGEDVPLDTMTLNKFAMAEFNSPYEEFSLVMELRNSRKGGIIRTHKPLAIYVPAERLKLWQTGRSESKIAQKKAKHRDVELDIFRQYILIYEWIEGAAAVEMIDKTDIPATEHAKVLEKLTLQATAELAARGYQVLDMKPAHIIVRATPDRKLLRETHTDKVAYALVDFELLERTPEHEQNVKRERRGAYLRGQSQRFGKPAEPAFPAHLRPVSVFDVDYVFGHCESTQGSLWVAGHVVSLFDFFLPERWRRTRKVPLSKTNEVYYTRTKDNINIVWKVSRVGEKPDPEPPPPDMNAILEYGYNSPFEEFAIALELGKKGVPTVYPRAIYMTGLQFENADYIEDPSRYRSHASILTHEGLPVLNAHHNYITIWGFWNGLDEMLAQEDKPMCEGINLELAFRGAYLTDNDRTELTEIARRRLSNAGFIDLNLKGDHILLSLNPNGGLVRDSNGMPEFRFCNFELIKRL